MSDQQIYCAFFVLDNKSVFEERLFGHCRTYMEPTGAIRKLRAYTTALTSRLLIM
jgi:hypothetical protein